MRRRRAWAGILGAGALIAVSAMPASASSRIDTTAAVAPALSPDRERALRCMSLAIAYEAGYESLAGQEAVGQVIVNRTHHPAYPKSVCGVVFQGSSRRTGCQFTFTCDGAMRRRLPERIMADAREVALRVLAGEVAPVARGATHYHATYVSPYWAPSLIRVGRIGAHIFYRAPSGVDASNRYGGGAEPEIAGLGSWLTAIDPLTQGARSPSVSAPAPPATAPKTFAPWGLAIRP